MAQRNRYDEAGAWLHVMNRGVARRTVFEGRADARYFLAQLARAVRAGEIEVHAYSILTTHFHLLLRSPRGEAWRALRRVQNAYSRRFNRLRRRDGPLFRGRFRSKRIRSDRYWITVVRYIDGNATQAGLAGTPGDWEFGSARHYLSSRGPRWLSRSTVEFHATQGLAPYSPGLYDRTYGAVLAETELRLVQARMDGSDDANDPFDDLVGAAPERVAEWMRRKAALADGTVPGPPVVLPATIERVIDAARTGHPDRTVVVSGVVRSFWDVLSAGLLRLHCGVTLREIASRCRCSAPAAHGRVETFRRLMTLDPEFALECGSLVARALADDWPTTLWPGMSGLAGSRPWIAVLPHTVPRSAPPTPGSAAATAVETTPG